jgi:hypothetical protein
MIGDGVADIPEIGRWMGDAGCGGWNEIEICSAADWWKRDRGAFLATCAERCRTRVRGLIPRPPGSAQRPVANAQNPVSIPAAVRDAGAHDRGDH